MSARVIGLLLATLSLGASGVLPTLAWSQSGSKPPPELDATPVGKVLTVTGIVAIEHPAAILVQANLPAGGGNGPTKVGDLVYRGDVSRPGWMARSALRSLMEDRKSTRL